MLLEHIKIFLELFVAVREAEGEIHGVTFDLESMFKDELPATLAYFIVTRCLEAVPTRTVDTWD